MQKIRNMYMSSPSVSCGRIDDTVFFELEEIDGEQYLNTFDLVRGGEDGELHYEGRIVSNFLGSSLRSIVMLQEGA